MQSKTPQFDSALDRIFFDLVPHKRICLQKGILQYCEGEFQITDQDIEFLKLFLVPAPKLCPTCRRVRRFSFVNTATLYKRLNNASEKNEKIISFVPPVKPLIVYDLKSYQTIFEPFAYAMTYDESKPFFEQFYDLRLRVPQPAIVRDSSSVNSEYSFGGRNLKNGYCVSGGLNSKDVWYSQIISDSYQIMDSYIVRKSEQCYQSIQSVNLYNSNYIFFSKNCINSQFLYDCSNCQDCFGCVNLRNKRYCWFNKQLSKDEFEKLLDGANISSRKSREIFIDKFWIFIKNQPLRASRCEHSYDVEGVNVTDSKNCHHIFNSEKSEHERYTDSVIKHKDSMDVYVSGGSEKLYETVSVGSQCAGVKFSIASKFITDSEFVINCRNCNNCFACIGLENKSYCIFNHQYEMEQYFKELDRIKTSLLNHDEYGEFFPCQFSSFAYNGSSADLVFPLDKKSIENLGALWQPDVEIDLGGLESMSVIKLPDTIIEVNDSILNIAIICKETGRPFRIIPTELMFYRKHNIPLPNIHPYRRITNRFKYVGDGKIYKTVCGLCKENINSMYNPEENLILYCDNCYKQEFV